MPSPKGDFQKSSRGSTKRLGPQPDRAADESPTSIANSIQNPLLHRPRLSRRCVKLLHAMIVHLTPADDKTRMLNIEDDHDQHHERRIKDVKINLRAEENPFLAAGILGYAEDASNHDQEAGEVEDPKIARPRKS